MRDTRSIEHEYHCLSLDGVSAKRKSYLDSIRIAPISKFECFQIRNLGPATDLLGIGDSISHVKTEVPFTSGPLLHMLPSQNDFG